MATMQAVVYIGDKLKALRIEQALTQGELAEKASVALNTVARLERNENAPHMPTARKHAAGRDVHPRELTKGSCDGLHLLPLLQGGAGSSLSARKLRVTA